MIFSGLPYTRRSSLRSRSDCFDGDGQRA